MNTEELQATLKELMDKFDYYRLAWIENYGTSEGFSEWFTAQIRLIKQP